MITEMSVNSEWSVVQTWGGLKNHSMHQTPEALTEKQWDLYSLKKLHLFLLFTAPGLPKHSAFVASQKQKEKPGFHVWSLAKCKKIKIHHFLLPLQLLALVNQDYYGVVLRSTRLCRPGKLLHRGGSSGSVDLFMWGSCLQQTLRCSATALDSLAVKSTNTGLEHTRKVHGQSQ